MIRLLISLLLFFIVPLCSFSLESINDFPFIKPSGLFVLDSLIRAYPEKIYSLAYRKYGLSVIINNKIFYWASGKMLPENKYFEDFLPYDFEPYKSYQYDKKLTTEEIEAIDNYIKILESGKIARSPDFFNSLWGMKTFKEAENSVVNIYFLGFKIRIHPKIAPKLEKIEKDIIKKSKDNTEIAKWLNCLQYVGGYHWRNIAGSSNRSSHSYGISVDIIPCNYNNKQIYWRWSKVSNPLWWEIPANERYQMPEEVIKSFESEGFVWGGNWLFFDQIHFEYRPELIILGEYYGF